MTDEELIAAMRDGNPYDRNMPAFQRRNGRCLPNLQSVTTAFTGASHD